MDARQTVTKSGLIVPTSAVERKQRVLPDAVFRRLRRFIVDVDTEGIRTLLMCKDCSTPIHLELEDRLVDSLKGQPLPGGRPVLTCQCTDRVVR